MLYVVNGSGRDWSRTQFIKWELDLKKLASEGIARGRNFRGRPQLAKKLLDSFEHLHERVNPNTARRYLFSLTLYWQFLDEQEKISGILNDTFETLKVELLSLDEFIETLLPFVHWMVAQELSSSLMRSTIGILERIFFTAYDSDQRIHRSFCHPMSLRHRPLRRSPATGDQN